MSGLHAIAICMLLVLLSAGCAAQQEQQNEKQAQGGDLAGTWRIYGQTTSRILELKSDRTWSFGSSSGIWRVEEIGASDWQKWGVDPYGPTRKIMVEGWDETTATGPIEESAIGGRPDFFWLLYKATVEGKSGDAQIKFGHGYD